MPCFSEYEVEVFERSEGKIQRTIIQFSDQS